MYLQGIGIYTVYVFIRYRYLQGIGIFMALQLLTDYLFFNRSLNTSPDDEDNDIFSGNGIFQPRLPVIPTVS